MSRPFGESGRVETGALVCAGIGLVSLAAGFPFAPRPTWGAFLANVLFWTGLAQGGVVVVAALRLSEAKWSRSVERLALGMGGFRPIGVLLILTVWLGRGYLLPVNGAGWLLVRDAFVAGLLDVVSLRFTREVLAERPAHGTLRRLAGAVVIGYCLGYALIGADLGMTPDPEFHSSIFPLIYLAGSFYSAIAAAAVLTVLWRRTPEGSKLISSEHLLDLGNLVWGFAIFLGYLWWCQYLPIWMGNLPEEAAYHTARWRVWPWDWLAWKALSLAMLVPGLVLFSRLLKRCGPVLGVVAALAACGVMAERYLDVLPSLHFELNFVGVLILLGVFLGFLGGFTRIYIATMRRLVEISPEDPRLLEALVAREAVI